MLCLKLSKDCIFLNNFGGKIIYIYFLVVTVIVGSVENCVFLHGFWGKKSILILLSEKENKQQVWGVKWWKIAAREAWQEFRVHAQFHVTTTTNYLLKSAVEQLLLF